MGRGGISRVAEATGLSRSTIRVGLEELEAGPGEPGARLRRTGGGRKAATEKDPGLAVALERKLEPVTRGDPMGPLRWTCRSAERLAQELTAEGHAVSERTVNRMLHGLGYSLQANRKTLEGKPACGPGRAVRLHQPAGAGVPGRGAAGGFGGCQEEGVVGALPQRGPGSGGRRGSRRKWMCMISPTRSSARRSPTGSTI